MISDIRETISKTRSNESEFDKVFENMEQMAVLSGGTMTIPRLCSRQTQRNNVPATSPKEYFKRNIYIPYLDSLIQQLDMLFSGLARQSVQAMCLIPSNLSELNQEAVSEIKARYGPDMPDICSFTQELSLWKQMWSHQTDPPDSLSATLLDKRTCPTLFPNTTKVIHLMLLTSVTSSSVERANSSLRFLNSYLRTTMSEERFNALILLFLHRDIKIDIEEVISIFTRRYPGRMLLENPIS